MQKSPHERSYPSKWTCRSCGGRHHTLIHEAPMETLLPALTITKAGSHQQQAQVILDIGSCMNLIMSRLANALQARKISSPLDLERVNGKQASIHACLQWILSSKRDVTLPARLWTKLIYICASRTRCLRWIQMLVNTKPSISYSVLMMTPSSVSRVRASGCEQEHVGPTDNFQLYNHWSWHWMY